MEDKNIKLAILFIASVIGLAIALIFISKVFPEEWSALSMLVVVICQIAATSIVYKSLFAKSQKEVKKDE
jgi:hypothetical protein